MKRLLWLFLALGSVTISTPAAAQVEGSRFTRYATHKDAAAAFRMWAGCMAELDRKWARSLLNTVPTSRDEQNVLEKRLGMPDRCLEDSRLLLDNKELSMSAESIRGELARNLVRKQASATALTPKADAASGWLLSEVGKLPAGAEVNRPILIGHDFAACLADTHWPLVRSFVVAQQDSSEEASALQALVPTFGGCMSAGAKLKLNKPLLRLLLSEAAYHALTFDPASAPASVASAQEAK